MKTNSGPLVIKPDDDWSFPKAFLICGEDEPDPNDPRWIHRPDEDDTPPPSDEEEEES
jgi:hypothetical protein